MAIIEYRLYEIVPLSILFKDNGRNFLSFNLFYDNTDTEGTKRFYDTLEREGYKELGDKLKEALQNSNEVSCLGEIMSQFIVFNIDEARFDKDKKVINDCIPIYWEAMINISLLNLCIDRLTSQLEEETINVAKEKP